MIVSIYVNVYNSENSITFTKETKKALVLGDEERWNSGIVKEDRKLIVVDRCLKM